MGMRVQASEIRDKFGLSDPDRDAELLGAPAKAAPERIAQPSLRLVQALQQAMAKTPPIVPADAIGDQLQQDAQPDMEDWLEQIEAMMAAASDLGELREMLRSAYPQIGAGQLGKKIGDALVAAHAAGRFDVEAEGA